MKGMGAILGGVLIFALIVCIGSFSGREHSSPPASSGVSVASTRPSFKEHDLTLPGMANEDYRYMYEHGGLTLFTDIQRSGMVCKITKPNTVVRVIDQREEHIKIRYMGKEGWLSERIAFNR